MIEKHSFVDTLNLLHSYSTGVNNLEKHLGVCFESNWLTHTIDNIIKMLSSSFFTEEELNGLIVDSDIIDKRIDNITSLLYHFCYNCEFGKNSDYCKDVYRRGSISMNTYTSSEVYNIIIDYLTHTNEDVYFNACL